MDLWDVDIRRCAALPAQPALPARSHGGELGAALCDALAVPPGRDRARRAQVRPPRPPRGGRAPASARWPAGSAPTGSQRPGRAPRLRVQLRPAELVRPLRRRAPGGARTGRALRPVLVRQVPAQGARCRGRAQPDLRQRRRRAGGQGRLHAVAQRARRHRGRPHGDARGAGRLPHRHRCATQVRDFDWLTRHIPDEARAVRRRRLLGLCGARPDGPAAAATCSPRSPTRDLSTAAFPFGTSRIIDLGYARVRASRITYVGRARLGALHPDRVRAIASTTRSSAPGRRSGCPLAGLPRPELPAHGEGLPALGPRHHRRGHPARGRTQFAVAWDKPGGFIGREALLRQREAGVPRRLVAVALEHPDSRCSTTTSRSGATASSSAEISSGMFGHSLGTALGLGYVVRGRCAGQRGVAPQRAVRGRGGRAARAGADLVAAVLRPLECAGETLRSARRPALTPPPSRRDL